MFRSKRKPWQILIQKALNTKCNPNFEPWSKVYLLDGKNTQSAELALNISVIFDLEIGLIHANFSRKILVAELA